MHLSFSLTNVCHLLEFLCYYLAYVNYNISMILVVYHR